MLTVVLPLVSLLILLALLVTLGPLACFILVPLYIIWRRSHPYKRKLRLF